MSAPVKAPSKKNSSPILSLVTIALALLSMAAFILIPGHYVRSFISDASYEAFFDYEFTRDSLQDQLPVDIQLDHQQIEILSFWQPGCPCNFLSARHYENLLRIYGPDPQIQFTNLIVSEEKAAERLPWSLKNMIERYPHSQTGFLQDHNSLPAYPSVAIFYQGQLKYYGPFGFGAFCNQSSNGFLTQVVDDLVAGSTIQQLNLIGEGCFCSR